MTDEENDVDSSLSGDAASASEPPSNSESDVEKRRTKTSFKKKPTIQTLSFRSASELETGKPTEDHTRKVKAMSTREACGAVARRRSNIKKDFDKAMSPLRKRRARRHDNDDDSVLAPSVHGRLNVQAAHFHEGDDEESADSKGIQYRLSAQQPRQGMLFRMLRTIGISIGSSGMLEDDGGGQNSGCLCCGFSLNQWVTSYLNWTFRSSFLKVLLSAAVGFYVLTLSFALLIFASGTNHPDCVHVNGQDFGDSGAGNRFADAYSLSWTTFSTVGYGLVFPSTSSTVDSDHKRCTGIQILCTFESFVGILFASFCGAIVFGKVARTRSHAQVTFSDPIVVRYGKGLEDDADSDSSCSDDDEEGGTSHLSCPVLEFRVINRLHSTRGGELMDATMNVVASIDESQACASVRMASRGRRRKGRRHNRPSVKARAAIPRTVEEQASLPSPDSMDATLHPVRIKTYQAVDDDIDGEEASRRIFTKLELDVPDHPFFKRVWTVSHTLNAHSPLLSSKARRLVRENGGFWPAALGNYEAVRASIHFDQILVSLSGTSNADANSVYAQKIYDYVDMNVGYRFANVLYRNPRDGSLAVDPSIVNDVLEQYGGGAEPLTHQDEVKYTLIL